MPLDADTSHLTRAEATAVSLTTPFVTVVVASYLLDLAGRLVRRVEVGANGAGSDVVDLSPGRPLAPGIYVVRIRQGGFAAAARVAVLR